MSRYPDGFGGTYGRDIELANGPHDRPHRLTNGEVLERVARFAQTGDPGHLPPGLQHEAAGIMAWVMEGARHVAALGMPPWPQEAAGEDPGPDAPLGDVLRALAGPGADADSGMSA